MSQHRSMRFPLPQREGGPTEETCSQSLLQKPCTSEHTRGWPAMDQSQRARFYLMIRHKVLVDFQNLAPYKEKLRSTQAHAFACTFQDPMFWWVIITCANCPVVEGILSQINQCMTASLDMRCSRCPTSSFICFVPRRCMLNTTISRPCL